MNTLSIDLRTSLRAAVAVAMASGVVHLLSLQRAYWAIMVAVVVLAETWGSSIQKAVQRVAATTAGCIVGWGVQRLAGSAQWVQVGLLLVCIFLAIYFRGYSYSWMMFWITIYVVFLFSLLHEWSVKIALLRLEDTIIGGLVAIAATFIVPPARANQLRTDLADLWRCSQAQLASALAAIVPLDAGEKEVEACRDNLYSSVETLRAHAAVAPYENILRPLAVRRIRVMVEQTEALGRHALLLAELVRFGSPHRLRPLGPELTAAARAALSATHQLASESPADCEAEVRRACDALEKRAGELERSGEIDATELLFICSVAFHLVRVSACVARIVAMRRQLPANAEIPAAREAVVSG